MPTSILIDANLLVLLVVGLTDKRLIERHKNVSSYDADGFDLLVEKLKEFSEVLLTPNTLTEAYNLLRQIGEPERERLTLTLGEFIKGRPERYIPSEEASNEATFVRLGLTDAALMNVGRVSRPVLLSADRDLYLAASQEGFEALNFAHLYDAKFG